jgi:hypothetical protein
MTQDSSFRNGAEATSDRPPEETESRIVNRPGQISVYD